MQPITKETLAKWKEGYYDFSVDYTIRRGDNLTRISEATNIPIVRLANENNIENPDLIYEGGTLKLNFSGVCQGKLISQPKKNEYINSLKQHYMEINEKGVSVWLQENNGKACN